MDFIVNSYLALPVAFALIAMVPTLRNTHWFGGAIATGIGVSAGLMTVLAYWLAAKTHPNAIAGLIQWNDAAGYLACGRQLIAGAPLYPVCSMRPYYAAEFGALLALSGGSVQVALLVQAGLVGGVAGWFVHRLGCRGGAVASLAALCAILIFILQFTLPTLTENPGLLLGLLSIALLWERAGSITRLQFFVVMMVLTLALNARAGAFLVLPALLIWSVVFSQGDVLQRLQRSLFGLGGAIVAAGLTFGLGRLLGSEAAGSHSNFVYTLYAMSVNKSTYLQIFLDHPEIRNMPDHAGFIYGLIRENIMHRPEIFMLGYLRGGAMWAFGWFDFVPNFHVRAILFVLGLNGLLVCLRGWRGEREKLLLILFAAVAVSSPFLFPYGGSRILAATFPVDALLVAYGAAHLAGRKFSAVEAPPAGRQVWRVVTTAAAIALAPFPAALLLRAAPVLTPIVTEVECPAGQQPFVADFGRESLTLSLGKSGEGSLFPLVVDRDRFVGMLHPQTHHLEAFKVLKAGTTIVDAMQRLPNRNSGYGYGVPLYFLWDGAVPQGLAKGCVDPAAESWMSTGTSLTPLR